MRDRPSAVVLVVDRLGAGHLGPYGNTALDTPGFNQLASESLLFQCAHCDSPQLDAALRGWWFGEHPFQSPEFSDQPPQQHGANSLIAQAKREGIATHLVSDSPEILHDPGSAAFRRISPVTDSGIDQSCEALEETSVARVFAQAIQVLDRQTSPFLLWIHTQGMAGPWDAPYSLRQELTDEEDPDPPKMVRPPNMRLEGEMDPDELFGIGVAYAAQVKLVDMGVAALLDAVAEHANSHELLFALTAPRGFPLGEHQFIGNAENTLYGELTHVPLFLRFPDQLAASTRNFAPVHPPDLFCALADWFSLTGLVSRFGKSLLPAARGESDLAREYLLGASGQERSLRTNDWFMRYVRAQDNSPYSEAHVELYSKPDDFWEVNNVADRCSREVQELVAKMVEWERIMRAPESVP